MDDWEKFNETSLPEKDVQNNTSLLADIFENFRKYVP